MSLDRPSPIVLMSYDKIFFVVQSEGPERQQRTRKDIVIELIIQFNLGSILTNDPSIFFFRPDYCKRGVE